MKSFRKIVTSTTVLLFMTFSIVAQTNYSLDFNPKKYVRQTVQYNGKAIKIRAYEHIVYVSNPVDTALQIMNIYIPEAYFKKGKMINGYTSETAPIFFPNKIGGYMEAKPATAIPINEMARFGNITEPSASRPDRMPNAIDGQQPRRLQEGRPFGFGPRQQPSVAMALSRGYIVASAGARGRQTMSTKGTFTGKAPAAIVDLKAAIRYLFYNDKQMPGDARKIISNGTSAGGALSALLGATGDNADYLPYLTELGAAKTSDAIYASSAYCPITNLENADMAYEWQFYGINQYKKSSPFGPNPDAKESTLTDTQIQVSSNLKTMFPTYINSLGLKDTDGNLLKLDTNGEGSFKEFIINQIIISANKAKLNGTDISKYSWLTIEREKVSQINWAEYLNYLERQKTPPAFDALDLSSAENIEFGTATISAQHFTQFGMQNITTSNASMADKDIVKMMNPMNYIGNSKTKTAAHWRIRHGSKDKDTGLAISAMLTLKLQNAGFDVDYLLPWEVRHSGDYDLTELFDWMDKISK